jgi:hypothetical protein
MHIIFLYGSRLLRWAMWSMGLLFVSCLPHCISLKVVLRNISENEMNIYWQNSDQFLNIFHAPFHWFDWLFRALRPAQEFFSYDVTIAGEEPQNLGLCSTFRAFEQGGIFIMPHLLWHRTLVFMASSEGLPLSLASYDTRGGVEDLF